MRKADETRTEKDAASPKNLILQTEAEVDEEQELASKESEVPKNASEAQNVDAQKDDKVQNYTETKQTLAPDKAEVGKAQCMADEEIQPCDNANNANESASTAPAEEQAIAESKSATEQVSATANRQNETRQESKVAQSSAGTQNLNEPMFMTNDNFGCPDHVLKKIVADEYNL